MAFIPIILALIHGAAIGPILTGLTLVQWIDIAGAIAGAAPAIRKELVAVHQIFETLNHMAEDERKASEMGHTAYVYFQDNPEDGPPRTQEDINQDARIDDLEKRLDGIDEEISHLIKWISDIEKAQGKWKST